jgi:flavin-dependent dehydrogenase
MQPCRALDILVESEQVIGVKTSFAGEVLGDFIIDAGGGGHWLARKLNLTIEKYSSPLYAHYGYAKGECHARDQVPLIEATPDGWIWTAKVKNHLYQWTRLNFHKRSLARDWLPDEFRGLTPSQPIQGADVTWRRVIQPSALGYFIIGDAATVVDPASSHGVLKGLMSGIKAAHTIFRIVKDKFPITIASLEYNKWVSQWFFHDIAKLRELYMQHPSHPILRW